MIFKNRNSFRLLPFLCVIVCINLSCNRSFSPATSAQHVEDAKAALYETLEDIHKEGFIGEAKHLYNSPAFYWIPPRQSTPISYDSVVTILRKATPLYKEVKSTWQSLTVYPLTKKMVTYTGKYQSVYTVLSGKQSTFLMHETGVMIREKGKWLLLNGHTSLVETK